MPKTGLTSELKQSDRGSMHACWQFKIHTSVWKGVMGPPLVNGKGVPPVHEKDVREPPLETGMEFRRESALRFHIAGEYVKCPEEAIQVHVASRPLISGLKTIN